MVDPWDKGAVLRSRRAGLARGREDGSGSHGRSRWVRVLLDTHVLIWSLGQTGRLSEQGKGLLHEAEVGFFSPVAVWEVAIKFTLRRPEFGVDPRKVLSGARQAGLIELPVNSQSAARVAMLPLHHRDPFDRLLVAQAIEHDLFLLTVATQLAAYGANVRVFT